jgi:hypothetical protein
MAKVTIINSAPFSTPDYSDGDERAILPLAVSPSFTTENGRVEAFVYDLQGNLLNYNPNAKYSIIESGGNNDPNVASKLELYPEDEVRGLKIEVGTYDVSYNVLNNELKSSFTSPFALKQISANRKELRLTTSFLTEDELKEEVGKIAPSEITSPYYPDYVVNLGNNKISIVTNLLFDNSENQYSVLVKLYEPLPSYASERDAIWIASKQRDSIAYQVELEAPAPLPTPRKNVLKGPNFSLPLNNQVHSSVKLTSLEELQNLSGITTASRRQLGSILNENGVEINIDYSKSSNFIHFSSLEERIKNFHYKVELIESRSNQLNDDPAGSNSALSESRAKLENEISTIIDNFDGFEYWMYYTSGTYGENEFPKPWPKTNSEKPYTLASTSSADAIAWLETGSLSGSIYDKDNTDNLINTIPEYLREDSSNAPFEKFIEMIGQHFDTLYTYAQDITNRYNADNRLDFGISKDLVGDAIQSMGLNLYTGNFTSYDLVDSLVGTRVPSTQPDGQTNVDNYVTASSDVIPVEDVNKEIYKRIYHNLPLLVRQKGSLAGVRTLITCFGIPEEVLKIREFDIKGKSTIYDLPAVGTSASIEFSSESAVFPPSRSGWIPSKFLSPAVRVQQDYVKSESYDRSLQYVEVGYSPQGNVDEVEHSAFDPFDTSFPDFNDFYYGDDMNYYSSKFITGPQATGQTVSWNWSAFVRYIKFFDSSLFNMIKDFSPVRSSTATGVIIKPTIKERQRQRPAQISGQDFDSTNITASTQTEGYNWGSSSFYIRPIGNYFLRNGARGLETKANKDGAYVLPGSTGGTFNSYNRIEFAKSEDDWGRYDIKTPIIGITQSWDETSFHVLSYANPALNYISSSTVKTFTTNHNSQEEFYNGVFQQRANGIGNFDNYLDREQGSTGSAINDGSGVIRTDNNRFNPYKVAVNNTFALGLKIIGSITDFLLSSDELIYNTAASVIYIRIGVEVELTEDLLLQNGGTLNFSVGGTTVSYTVGSSTITGNTTGAYVAYYVISNPTGNENIFIAADGNDVIFEANVISDGIPGRVLSPWGSSEYNPLIGNSFDPNAGLVNYAGIRKSEIYQDVDYSPSASSSIVPINIDLLASGSASKAAVQDSNYESRFWALPRYYGVRNTSIDFNVPIITAIEDIDSIYTSESLGVDPFISKSLPDLPQLPPQRDD